MHVLGTNCDRRGASAARVRVRNFARVRREEDGVFTGVTVNEILTKGNRSESGGPAETREAEGKKTAPADD